MSFSIDKAFRAGWESWKQHAWLALGFYITYLLIMALTHVLSLGFSATHMGEEFLFAILRFLISTFALMGWVFVNLKMTGFLPVRWADFFYPIDAFPRFLGGSLLYGLLIAGGCLFILIPVLWVGTFERNPDLSSPHHWLAAGLFLAGVFLLFYWLLIFGFWPYFILDRQASILNAFRESKKATRGHRWKLAGLTLLLMGVNFLGLLCFVIGLLVTVPVTALIWTHAYKQLRG